jgi:general secretion pathway protein A
MPFENTSDPPFFYHSPYHKEALARMRYAMSERKPGMILTGKYGVGKTFVCNVAVETCHEYGCVPICVNYPRLTSEEFLGEINSRLRAELDAGPAGSSKAEMYDRFRRYVESCYDGDTHPVLIVDETQDIGDDVFEEIRLLLNIQRPGSVMFTLILAGQPPLEDRMESLPALKQRMAMQYRLSGLTREETGNYIGHRLRVSGRDGEVITKDAVEQIFAFSRGLPRSINNVCDVALLTGFLSKASVVDRDVVLQAGAELGLSGAGRSAAEGGVRG